MHFFVVDNRITHLTSLQQLLTGAFPESTIWPEGPKTLANWQTVADELQVNTKDDPNLVVILDLGIESEDMASLHSGVEQAFALKSLRPSAVFISYTQWPDLAEVQPHYEETFDAGIDKQRLSGYETSEEQQNYVHQIVRSAVRDRLGSKPSYVLKDSFGLRLAVAAFGDRVFDFLIEDVAANWADIEVSALTSGHSGAFIFRISGTLGSVPQRIIVKCARDAQLIKTETGRLTQFLAELGPLAEVLAPFEQHPRQLPHDIGYYYRQAEIKGEPLLGMLYAQGWNKSTQTALATIVALELRCYQRGDTKQFGRIPASQAFRLTPIDRGRAAESLRFLKDLGSSVKEAEAWPEAVPPSEMTGMLTQMIEDWTSLLSETEDLLVVAQHGDLNPGNVLVPSADKVVLIDFSRVGRWPVGYDISRLSTMLRIRLTDSANHVDWAQNRVNGWATQTFASVGPEVIEEREAQCPAAAYCDTQFRSFIESCPVDERNQLVRGYKLGTLWDLLKVLSYSDLSPFKRLWAFIVCWRLGVDLGLLKN